MTKQPASRRDALRAWRAANPEKVAAQRNAQLREDRRRLMEKLGELREFICNMHGKRSVDDVDALLSELEERG